MMVVAAIEYGAILAQDPGRDNAGQFSHRSQWPGYEQRQCAQRWRNELLYPAVPCHPAVEERAMKPNQNVPWRGGLIDKRGSLQCLHSGMPLEATDTSYSTG